MTSKFSIIMLVFVAVACQPQAKDSGAQANGPATNLRQFVAQGIVRELKSADQTVVIEHQAISNYMAAMTMPFKVKQPGELAGLQCGDQVSFRLLVSDEESWIDHIIRTRERTLTPDPSPIGVPLSHRMGEGPGVRASLFGSSIGAWNLEFLWTLELGTWSFFLWPSG